MDTHPNKGMGQGWVLASATWIQPEYNKIRFFFFLIYKHNKIRVKTINSYNSKTLIPLSFELPPPLLSLSLSLNWTSRWWCTVGIWLWLTGEFLWGFMAAWWQLAMIGSVGVYLVVFWSCCLLALNEIYSGFQQQFWVICPYGWCTKMAGV